MARTSALFMRGSFLSIVILLVFFGCVTNANADDWLTPEPFDIVSSDGTMVFHFSPDNKSEEDASAAVYRNSEPEELMYTVHGLRSWAYRSDFYFSESFHSFAFIPAPTQDIALQFFADGVLVKTYMINDLVQNRLKLERSTSSVWWIQSVNNEKVFIPDDDTLTITTVDGITYLFDITDGSILEKHPDSPGSRIWLYAIFGALGLGVAFLLVIALNRNNHRRNRQHE